MGGVGSVIVTLLLVGVSDCGCGCKGQGTDAGNGHGTDDGLIFLASVLGLGVVYGFGSKAGCEASADSGFGTAPIVEVAVVALGTGSTVDGTLAGVAE